MRLPACRRRAIDSALTEIYPQFVGSFPQPMKTPRPAWFACALVCATLCAQNARLANLSTRGQVGTDANNLFGGGVILPPFGWSWTGTADVPGGTSR